jgi:PKD repeat protein
MKRKFRKNHACTDGLALIFALLFVANVVEADDYSTWTYSAAITLNTTASGANVANNVTNFPVLIRLNPGNFSGFANTLAGGADIRFAKKDGTHLAYQIERWVDGASNNDTAEIWVKLDTVYGNNSTQSIKLFWGKSSAGDSSSGSAVFDTANGFQAAWHLGEPGTGNTIDATINNYTGTANGTTRPVDTIGIIGRAKKFDGAASYFDVTGSASGKLNFPQGGPYTISAWVYTNVANGAYHDFVAKGDHQYSVDISNSNNWQITEFKDNVGWVAAGSAAAAGAWQYFAGVRNGTGISLYVNGVHVADSNFAYASVLPRISTFDVTIGWNLDSAGFGSGGAGSHFFNGRVDELILANMVRSADWIKLCYENQKAVQTLTCMLAPPANLTYSSNPATYSVGTAIAANSPTSTGGAVALYSVSHALPAGLTLNTSTGVITGIPTSVTTTTFDTVTANNAAGSATAVLSITVNAALLPPANLTYSTNPATYVASTPITANSPTSSGGAIASYSVSPALPLGLSLNTATGVITGTPTTVNAAANYVVTATDAAGSTAVVLSITVIAASAPPVITTQPQSQTVAPGQSVTFTAAASGNPTPSYQWRLNGTSILGATSSSYTIPSVSSSFAGTYSVAATNTAGSATSNGAVLNVLAKANFTVSAAAGKMPLAVTFTDASLGVVTKRYWYFGDNSVLDSTISPSHTYATEGTFTAKLVVFDYSGARGDSMTVVIRTYNENPVLIVGHLISSGNVEVTYANYNALPVGPLVPFADSIALWYKPGSIPLSGTGATRAKNYLPSTMQSLGMSNPLKDTVALPLPLADTMYGFVTTVHWTDGTWSNFALKNGCIVSTLPTTSPAAPSLVFPAGGAVNVPIAASFRWHPVPTASTYRLQISITPDFSAIVKDSSGLTDTVLSLSNLSSNTNYYWCVNATNPRGTGAWSTTSAFTTALVVPCQTVLVNPLDTTKIPGDLVLLVWNKAAPAVTRYLVQIAADSGMSHILLLDSTVMDTSTILMSLAANTSYWWQVKAYNSSGWGPYSSKYEFTILSAAAIARHPEIRAFDVHYSSNVLRYALPDKCFVTVRYYDVKGRAVASFVNKVQSAGYYTQLLPASCWSRGTYIQIFRAGTFEKRETIVVAK